MVVHFAERIIIKSIISVCKIKEHTKNPKCHQNIPQVLGLYYLGVAYRMTQFAKFTKNPTNILLYRFDQGSTITAVVHKFLSPEASMLPAFTLAANTQPFCSECKHRHERAEAKVAKGKGSLVQLYLV